MSESRTTPVSDQEASALPLRDEVVVWRGVKATPTAVLVDYIVVGNEMEKALIEETARRRRAEILLAAMNANYARDHADRSIQSESTRLRPASEWHEDMGDVLWWRLPVSEPPWVGSPLTWRWPLSPTLTEPLRPYYTHFEPLPEAPKCP